MKTMPERDPQQKRDGVYSIPRVRGRNYIFETGRPVVVQIREHSHNSKKNQNSSNMPMKLGI
jgi:hypothetical protein